MSSPFDSSGLGGIFEEIERLQRQLASAEATAEGVEVEGSAGGGAVRIAASGEFDFRRVHIDPAVLSDGDPALLEDLVLAALRDATTKLLALRRSAMNDAVGGALAGLLGGDLLGGDPLGGDESADGEPGELDAPDERDAPGEH